MSIKLLGNNNNWASTNNINIGWSDPNGLNINMTGPDVDKHVDDTPLLKYPNIDFSSRFRYSSYTDDNGKLVEDAYLIPGHATGKIVKLPLVNWKSELVTYKEVSQSMDANGQYSMYSYTGNYFTIDFEVSSNQYIISVDIDGSSSGRSSITRGEYVDYFYDYFDTILIQFSINSVSYYVNGDTIHVNDPIILTKEPELIGDQYVHRFASGSIGSKKFILRNPTATISIPCWSRSLDRVTVDNLGAVDDPTYPWSTKVPGYSVITLSNGKHVLAHDSLDNSIRVSELYSYFNSAPTINYYDGDLTLHGKKLSGADELNSGDIYPELALNTSYAYKIPYGSSNYSVYIISTNGTLSEVSASSSKLMSARYMALLD